MPRVALVVPGDLHTRTGGYVYDRRIADGLRALDWCVEVRHDVASLDDATPALVDGLALLTLADEIDRHAERLRLVPIIHLPLGLEVGLDVAEAERRDHLERRALRHARAIVVTGQTTVEALVSRGVDPSRIRLVEPGTDRAPAARGSSEGSVAILCVAALTPGKGHELLLRALATVADARWVLTCAGSVERDPRTAERVRTLAAALGIADRVRLVGELDDRALAAEYDRSDVFTLATRRETFGMAVAEAIARGLPVVSTTTGAIGDIVGSGGLLVAPGDEGALAAALARVITNAELRRQLGSAARAAAARLRTWEQASEAMANVLAAVSAR